MGAEIHITELEASNEEFQRRLKNPAPVLQGPIAEGVHELFQKIFESEGSYAGDPWAPLAEYTLARKARLGFPDSILVESGDLMNSLVDPESRFISSLTHAGAGYTEMRDPTTVAIGTHDEVGFLHQGGTSRMPARPIAPDVDNIPDADIDAWTEFAANYLLDGVY